MLREKIFSKYPGRLYGKVTSENFSKVSDYRNPFVAEAMKVLGYVNRFSRGVYRVQKESEENGNGKAIFDFSLVIAFRVVEKVSEKYFEEGFGIDTTPKNEETAQKPPRNRPETTQKLPENYPEVIRRLPGSYSE